MINASKIKNPIGYFLIALIAIPLFITPSNAQETASALPPALQQESMEKLASDLDPDQVNALADLVTLLQEGADAKNASTDASAEGGSFIEQLQSAVGAFGAMIAGHFQNLPALVTGIVSGIAALFAGSVAGPVHILLGSIALLLVTGCLNHTRPFINIITVGCCNAPFI
jgi:hypothetical protein